MSAKELDADGIILIGKEPINLKLYQKGGESFGPVFTEIEKGVRWFYSGQYMGKKYHSKIMFLTKRECARAERDKLQELDDSERNLVVDVCLMELFNHRLDSLQLTRNPDYYWDNKRLCQKILKDWGNISVSDVTRKMVSDLILAEVKRCKKMGLTNSRPNKLFSALSATFNHASKYLGLDLKNPCNGLSKLPED